MSKRFKSEARMQSYYSAYEATMELWPCKFQECFIETKYGRTHVIECGTEGAPSLVLFHGMGASSTMWYPNIGELAKHFKVYAVDSIGDFGKSEPYGPITNKHECIDWIGEVLDRLELTQTYMAGQSMGGWLAAIFTAAFPERCKALVLLAPVATVTKLKPAFFLRMYPAILFRSRRWIRALLHWCHAPNNRPHPVFEEQFIRGFQDGIFMLRAVPTVLDREERSRLPRTLFVVGDEEVIYSPSKAVKEAEAFGFETKLIPASSHCLTSERSMFVNGAIISFLRRDYNE